MGTPKAWCASATQQQRSRTTQAGSGAETARACRATERGRQSTRAQGTHPCCCACDGRVSHAARLLSAGTLRQRKEPRQRRGGEPATDRRSAVFTACCRRSRSPRVTADATADGRGEVDAPYNVHTFTYGQLTRVHAHVQILYRRRAVALTCTHGRLLVASRCFRHTAPAARCSAAMPFPPADRG